MASRLESVYTELDIMHLLCHDVHGYCITAVTQHLRCSFERFQVVQHTLMQSCVLILRERKVRSFLITSETKLTAIRAGARGTYS